MYAVVTCFDTRSYIAIDHALCSTKSSFVKHYCNSTCTYNQLLNL